MSRIWSEHGPSCWITHDVCALRAAADLMEARTAHVTAQRDMFRMALRWNDTDLRGEALDLARRVLHETHARNWKSEEALP